jgi:polyisoprenoid-binding protein YceI
MNQIETAATKASKKTSERFVIDCRSSRFTVRAFATGLLSAMGHSPTIGIRDFSGEVKFDPDQLKAEAFRITIKSSSLGVQDDVSDKDRREMERLMNQEVLETAKFPQILYEASGVPVTAMGGSLYSATLNGNLTLHGVTRSEPIAVRVASMSTMLRASGEFSLSQSNYAIKPVSVAGGALKLKDELKFQFDIVARKADDEQ